MLRNLDDADKKIVKMEDLDPEMIVTKDSIEGYMVVKDEEKIGFFALCLTETGVQTPMFLYSQYRNQGLGSRMIDLIEKTCRYLRISKIYHRIELGNKQMIKLSLSKNYREIDEDYENCMTLCKEV